MSLRKFCYVIKELLPSFDDFLSVADTVVPNDRAFGARSLCHAHAYSRVILTILIPGSIDVSEKSNGESGPDSAVESGWSV